MTSELDLVFSEIAHFKPDSVSNAVVRAFVTRAIEKANDDRMQRRAPVRTPEGLLPETSVAHSVPEAKPEPKLHIDIAGRLKACCLIKFNFVCGDFSAVLSQEISLENLLPICLPRSEVVDKIANQVCSMHLCMSMHFCMCVHFRR